MQEGNAYMRKEVQSVAHTTTEVYEATDPAEDQIKRRKRRKEARGKGKQEHREICYQFAEISSVVPLLTSLPPSVSE